MSVLSEIQFDRPSRQGVTTPVKPGTGSVEELQALGAQAGLDLETPKPKRGFLGGLEKFANFLSTGEFLVGGTLDALKRGEVREALTGTAAKRGVIEKISPSDVLLGQKQPESRLGKFLKGAGGLALDIGLDPTTYITLGVGGALKGTVVKGSRVLLSKSGKVMLREFAEEVGEKEARRRVSQLAAKTPANLIERGGLQDIKKALEATGKEVTRSNVDIALREGVTGLRAADGLKFAGFQVAKSKTLAAPFRNLAKRIKATEAGAEFATRIKDIGQAIAKTFSRDYGLDEIFIKNKQILLDGLQAETQVIGEQVLAFKGLTAKQNELILKSIEKGDAAIKALEPMLRKPAIRFQQIMRQIQKEAEQRGIMNQWIEDYVPHAYKNVRAGKELLAGFAGKPSALDKFAKARRIPTISEAEELGLEPIKDLAELTFIRMMSHRKAVLMQDFIRQTVKNSGKPLSKVAKSAAGKGLSPKLNAKILALSEDVIQVKEVLGGAPDNLKNLFIPRNIAESISKMDKRLLNDPDLGMLLRGYDKGLNFFKGSVTVLFPAFHARNAISNVLQLFLDIGVAAFDPRRHKQAVNIMRGATGDLVTDLGSKLSYDDIRKLARQKGVLTERVTAIDIDISLGKLPKVGTGALGAPARAGRKVGRAIEGEARMVSFIENLRRGFEPDEAARRVKEFIFDYDNLSSFEKDFMRRVVPFWTWTSKNIALQLKGLATQPGKQLGQLKFLREIENLFGERKTEEEKKFAPDFILAGSNALLARKGDDREFLVGFDMPIEAAFDFFTNPLKEMIGWMSPVLKMPLELSTGRNFFKEKQIAEDTRGDEFAVYPKFIRDWLEFNERTAGKGEDAFKITTVNPTKKYMINQLEIFTGLSRITSQGIIQPMDTMIKILNGEELTTVEERTALLRFLTGMRGFTVDIKAAQKAFENNQMDELIRILERNGLVRQFDIDFIPKDVKRELQQGTQITQPQVTTEKKGSVLQGLQF